MNGEIGPVADKIYEIWNYTIFVIWIVGGKFLINNLYEQQAYI